MGDAPGEVNVEKVWRKVKMLRDTNASLVQEIESIVGPGAIDLGTARFEHFVGYLVDIGLLSDEQHATEALAWEHSLKSQLVPSVQKARELARQAAARDRNQRGRPNLNFGAPIQKESSESQAPADDGPSEDGVSEMQGGEVS